MWSSGSDFHFRAVGCQGSSICSRNSWLQNELCFLDLCVFCKRLQTRGNGCRGYAMQWVWFGQSNPQAVDTSVPGVEGKPQFTIYIAALFFWPFHANPALMFVYPGWMKTQEAWGRLTHLDHNVFVLWSLSVTAYSFAGFSAVCTWPTELKKGSLDQQLRANNSCWLTLRGCGVHLPCITVLSILPEKQETLKANPAPASQITLEMQRLLCRGNPWGLVQLEQLQNPETKVEHYGNTGWALGACL